VSSPVSGNHVVVATFAINTYSVSASVSGGNGSVSVSNAAPNYGDTATVTVTPNTGYHIATLTDNGNPIALTSSVVFSSVSGNHVVVATFAINTYQLHYAAVANGSISGTASQTVNYNGSGTLVTAVPAVGYHFVSWSDGITSAARTDTAVTTDLSVTASFAINVPSIATTYTVTAVASANGTVSPASQSVNSGDNATVTVTPDAGYHIGAISVDGNATAAVSPVVLKNVTAPHTVSVTFAINTYTLSYAANANGSIVGSATQVVNSGSNGTTVTATPNAGYYFTQWSDGVLTAARQDTGVTANKSVTASFAAKRNTTVTIQSDAYSVTLALRGGKFVLTGLLTPGAYLDPVVVEVQKPNQSPSVPWSYSSNRLCYETVGGSGHWWYRYTPLLTGTYNFRVHFVGDTTRNASYSRVISVVVH